MKKNLIRPTACILALLSATLIPFLLVYTNGWETNTSGIHYTMAALILAAFGICTFLWYRHDFDWRYAFFLVLSIGCILRIGYMLYTPYLVRGHDLGTPDLQNHGHLNYIVTLFETGSLPATNAAQFYHPPLFHILSALSMKFIALFWHTTDISRLLEAAKLISCLSSCGLLLIVYEITKELKLSHASTLIVLCITAFLPNMYLTAGRVNNDSLVYFFMTCILWFTVKWYKKQTFPTIVMLAFLFGLGIMTKISCGTLAFITGPVMLIKWIPNIHNKNGQRIFGQLVLFAAIAVPLALWYPIRNYLLFHQPLTYVLPISTDSTLYCGNCSFVKRFLALPFPRLFSPLYNNPYQDYNLLLYTIKGSLFGEFRFEAGAFLPILLLASNTILIVLSIPAMIYCLLKATQTPLSARIGIFSVWAVQWLSYLFFNLKYPFGCTMDFRYIVLTAITGSMVLGIAYEELKCSEHILVKILRYLLTRSLAVFCVASVLMFCLVK